MPRIDLVTSSDVKLSTRAKQLASMFELEAKTTGESWSFDLQLPDEWSIGLIVGASGSGKSTVARHLYSGQFSRLDGWPEDGTLVDGFTHGAGIKEVAAALSSVGFSSPPAWLRPHHALSNGQQFRANVARALVESDGLFVIDEFTSVVDRTVARVGSAAVAKAVRRSGRQFVAVSCHYDIVDWLQPDWVLEMPSGTLTRRSVQRHPAITLEVTRVHRAAWDVFSQHHYLNHGLAKSAACYVATWNGRPVAFASTMIFPHPTKSSWREHRTVCLPDFQGVGIGNKLSELVAAAYSATSKHYISTTSHPAMIRYRAHSKRWRMARKPSRVKPRGRRSTLNASSVQSTGRLTASFHYVGEPNPAAACAFGLI